MPSRTGPAGPHVASRRHAANNPTPRRSRPASFALTISVAVGTLAAGALAAGPAAAHEPLAAQNPAAAHEPAGRYADPVASGPSGPLDIPATPSAMPDPQDAFARMIADARARQTAAALAERQRIQAEHRDRAARLAEKRARALAAKVRASRAALHSPVVRPIAGGYRLTARFDDGGSLWGSGEHTGLDFACPAGTPVRVVAAGTVVAAGYDGAYGNRIEVRHADGTVTTYSHLSGILVSAGRVRAGQLIGRVGSTGNATGTHLHFEVLRGQTYVDPETWLRGRYVSF